LNQKVIEIENICAAAAACQNILLAAHVLGLGARWRTGDAARDPQIKKFLGFSEDQHLIAFFVYWLFRSATRTLPAGWI